MDAIEHWMIYQEHPDVGAILHVHAWMRGHRGDRHQLPLRHRRAGHERRGAARAGARPAHAVIGLRNHGITVTGESLTEILDRIEPKVLRQIPMS